MQESIDDINYSFYESIINKFGSVPKEEWAFMKSILEVRSFKKGQYLLQEGQICKTLYFIIKGCTRVYYINDLGIEITYDFTFENNFVVSFPSLFTQSPAHENIVLLEDCTMFILCYRDFKTLLTRHPIWEVILNGLLKKHFFRIHEKEKMLLLNNHETRYIKLFSSKPYIFQRIEQKYIASYLGMTPETLSRIKKRIHVNRNGV